MSMLVEIIILLAVLAAMIMVLLAIRQLTNFEGFEDREETVKLKEEVEEDGHILSRNSIFHTLVEAEPVEPDPEDKIKNRKGKL